MTARGEAGNCPCAAAATALSLTGFLPPASPHYRTSPAEEPGPTDISTRAEGCNRPRIKSGEVRGWGKRSERSVVVGGSATIAAPNLSPSHKPQGKIPKPHHRAPPTHPEKHSPKPTKTSAKPRKHSQTFPEIESKFNDSLRLWRKFTHNIKSLTSRPLEKTAKKRIHLRKTLSALLPNSANLARRSLRLRIAAVLIPRDTSSAPPSWAGTSPAAAGPPFEPSSKAIPPASRSSAPHRPGRRRGY